MVRSALFLLAAAASEASAGTGPANPSCKSIEGVDIDPHTPGLGSVGGSSIAECCAACSSATWWAKGCRFYTLSKGKCWLKATNSSVVKTPGKTSGQALAQAAPPPPPPPWPKKGPIGDWTTIGPWGIGDSIDGQGEAGTLADAVSPAGNPKVIYAGGRNNGASSGIMKSVDGGLHWVMASNGIFDTRIVSLGIVDMDKGDHVYTGTASGIYETTDGAESWTKVNTTVPVGNCYTFKNGTIGGVPHILASCDCGIASIPTAGGDWACAGPGGWGRGGYLSVADAGSDGKLLQNSVVGGCLGGKVFVGTIINKTSVDWTTVNGTGRPCVMLALDPNNQDHFIYTHPPETYQTTDGGATYESLNHSNIFHCGIDRKSVLYTAAMGGAFVSHDCGPGPNMKRPCSWQAYFDNRTARRAPHAVRVRGAHDYQRAVLDFGGSVAFVADQGLFIVDYDNSSNLELIKANGNMSNVIALKAAISKGGGTKETRSIVTAVWDWAPLGSWDSGAHWPSWQNTEDGAGASCIGEGGGSYAMGDSNHVLIMHHHNIMHSAIGGRNMTRFITPHAGTIFGPAYQTKGTAGKRSVEPNGFVMAPLFITVPWDVKMDQLLAPSACQNSTDITANLTQHTNYSCLSAIDMGAVYGTAAKNCTGSGRGKKCVPLVDYAVWDGNSCTTCQVAGNSSDWEWTSKKGSIGYVRKVKESDRSYHAMMKYDMNGDGVVDAGDMAASMLHSDKQLEEADGRLELLEAREKGEDDDDDENEEGFSLEVEPITELDQLNDMSGDSSGGDQPYILKSFNYGGGMMNWTYTMLPPHLGTPGFLTDPTNQSVIYAMNTNGGCISASYDTGDTWSECWNQPPSPPSADAAGFHKSAGDLSAGHDLQYPGGELAPAKTSANLTEAAAETWCKAQANCSGFTALSDGGADATKKIFFKHGLSRPMGSSPLWVTYVKVAASGPPPPRGAGVPAGKGLVGSFSGMVFLDSMHIIVNRKNDVPLRTKDGGETWTPMDSCKLVAKMNYGLMYSWTGKTLIMMGSGGPQTADHPHSAFVWVSKDDGETWIDETGDHLVTMGPGPSNWYENDFYINSMGQGIMVKTLEDSEW